MILLFFSVWAIAIALSEVMFSSQPFALESIISTLPHTLIFSALLSAAVYLAKSKIIEAIHKGRPIDKKFVAEITPEVGHELNKMRKTIESFDEQDENWRDLSQDPNIDINSPEYAQAQALFAKLSALAAQGQLDPNDPELKLLIEKAKESGLDIQNIMDLAENQSSQLFPEISLPDSQADASALSDNLEHQDLPQGELTDSLDATTLASKEQNISELVDKYRSQGHAAVDTSSAVATDSPLASLERLAASPEFNPAGHSLLNPENTVTKSLENTPVQPIRPINIQEREKQQALEQARQQQRRNAQLDALSAVVSNEDVFLSQFRAAAAQGNQLAKTQTQQSASSQSVAQANPSQRSKDSAKLKSAQLRSIQIPQGVNLNQTQFTPNLVDTPPQTKVVTPALPKEPITPSSLTEQMVTIENQSNFSELPPQGLDLEPQDQVVNLYDIQERPKNSSSPQEIALKPNNEGQGHVRLGVDNPSLVDTSNLKKYQYVPPKKGAGLDTSALKKVTLPNYNRSSNGPSRLGASKVASTSKVASSSKNASTLRSTKKTVASTASLSVEERQELMARLRKNNLSSKQPEARKANWQSAPRSDNQRLNNLSPLGLTARTPNVKAQSDFVLRSAAPSSASPSSGSATTSGSGSGSASD